MAGFCRRQIHTARRVVASIIQNIKVSGPTQPQFDCLILRARKFGARYFKRGSVPAPDFATTSHQVKKFELYLLFDDVDLAVLALIVLVGDHNRTCRPVTHLRLVIGSAVVDVDAVRQVMNGAAASLLATKLGA
jgi:hypothetical protein